MKIAYSGTHGTGKSTSVFNECFNYKKKYKDKEVGIITEIPRKSPFPLNQQATVQSQWWIFSTQIKKELEFSNIYDIVICDRSIVDGIAYTYFIDKSLSISFLDMAEKFINTYHKIYFKLVKNNDYLIDDGVRATDKKYQKDVEDKMLEFYYGLGKELIFI